MVIIAHNTTENRPFRVGYNPLSEEDLLEEVDYEYLHGSREMFSTTINPGEKKWGGFNVSTILLLASPGLPHSQCIHRLSFEGFSLTETLSPWMTEARLIPSYYAYQDICIDMGVKPHDPTRDTGEELVPVQGYTDDPEESEEMLFEDPEESEKMFFKDMILQGAEAEKNPS